MGDDINLIITGQDWNLKLNLSKMLKVRVGFFFFFCRVAVYYCYCL